MTRAFVDYNSTMRDKTIMSGELLDSGGAVNIQQISHDDSKSSLSTLYTMYCILIASLLFLTTFIMFWYVKGEKSMATVSVNFVRVSMFFMFLFFAYLNFDMQNLVDTKKLVSNVYY